MLIFSTQARNRFFFQSFNQTQSQISWHGGVKWTEILLVQRWHQPSSLDDSCVVGSWNQIHCLSRNAHCPTCCLPAVMFSSNSPGLLPMFQFNNWVCESLNLVIYKKLPNRFEWAWQPYVFDTIIPQISSNNVRIFHYQCSIINLCHDLLFWVSDQCLRESRYVNKASRITLNFSIMQLNKNWKRF